MASAEQDLERAVHQALKRLPAPTAPASLSPRVMAAVRARREAPWYTRPMATWPLRAQLLVVALAVVPLVPLALWLVAGEAWQPLAARLGVAWPRGADALLPAGLRQLAAQAAPLFVLWRVVFAPVLMYAAVFAVAVGCVFAVCAAALTRVVLGRMPAQAG